MVSPNNEEQNAAPKHQGCHQGKSFGPWWKLHQQPQLEQQQQHHHHHYHHHHHITGVEQRYGHCHRSRSAWWGRQKCGQQPQIEHFHSACPLHQEAPPARPRCFFRGGPRKETMFDYSENYN